MRRKPDEIPVYYFAYGSNMSIDKLKARGVNPIQSFIGKLYNYEISFNKLSSKDNTIGFANILPSKNSIVEGIVYKVLSCDIDKLDIFEGYPGEYKRIIVKVNDNEDSIFSCVAYVANINKTSTKKLIVTDKYLNEILSNINLTNDYIDHIKNITSNERNSQ